MRVNPLRLLATLLALTMLVAACGTRVDDEQRRIALASGSGGAVGAAAPALDGGVDVGLGDGGDLADDGLDFDDAGGGTGTDLGAGFAGAGESDAAGSGGGDAADPGGPEDGAGGADGVGGGAPAEDGAGPAGGDEGASSGGGAGALDPRQVPPGGNGGATDTGVTEDQIVVANISDVSGAVPGLFEPEQLAAQARLAFENARGPIFGRSLQFLPFDGRLNAGANRAASIEACERAFATAGSMSAFDQGGAPVIDECGIPDVRTAATTPPMQMVDNAYPISITRPDKQQIGDYRWIDERFPGVGQKAAYLYIDGEVTALSTKKTRDATAKALGWEWVYVQAIGISEHNYSPFALRMKEEGVRFVTFQGAYQQAVRLAQAMQQQGFKPDVYKLQSNTYNPDLLASGGPAVEDVLISITSIMVEEGQQNAELQRYAQWLNQVAPGHKPTSLGMYSWSATSLLIDILKRIGPEATREKVLAELAKVRQWDGNGLHPPIDVGARTPNQCFVMVQVKGGRFTRAHPASGFDCAGPIVDM
jgi:ABC-type branched-subunit amino acid transport system substrate-binding protein